MAVRVNLRKDNAVTCKAISIAHQHLHVRNFRNQGGNTEKLVNGGSCDERNSGDFDDEGPF